MKPLMAYCVASAALLFALAARILLDPFLGGMQVYVTLYAAVAIAVWVGGGRVAALVALLGYTACRVMFPEPVGLSETRTVVGMLAYFATCSLIIVIGEAMRAAKRRAGMLAQLVENSTDFIGLRDLRFVPFYINRAGLEMVGLDSIERGAEVKDFLLPADRARLTSELLPAVKERGYAETELRFRHLRNNETRRMAYKVIALTDAAGKTVAYGTVSQDITEERRLEDNLLDLGRIAPDWLKLCKERVEIGAVIRQALQCSPVLADCAAHALNVVLPSEPVYLHADGGRLAQVFASVLDNACKYTPTGGTVSITAERLESHVVVTVEDNGFGIPPERLETVFELCEQPARAHSQGLAIGLPLVRRLVQMHGGMVQAKSAGPGLGSSFIVRLPVAR